MASRIRLPRLLLGLHTIHPFTLVIINMIVLFILFLMIVTITFFFTRSLPIAAIQHGGLAFLLIYLICLTVVGAPLLLLETTLGKIFIWQIWMASSIVGSYRVNCFPGYLYQFLLPGQYSALAPARLYRHLCPILAGLGLAIGLQAALRAILELATLMWTGQGLFLLFSEQQITDGFFYRDVLDRGDATMVRLGSLGGQLSLVLAIAAVSTFVLTVAGTRALGKVCGLAIPTAFMLLVTLTIRACMESGGPLGITALMAPNWEVMTQPGVWMEAVAQVIFCASILILLHDPLILILDSCL